MNIEQVASEAEQNREQREHEAVCLLRTMERKHTSIQVAMLVFLALETVSFFTQAPQWITSILFGLVLLAIIFFQVSWQWVKKARKIVREQDMARLETMWRQAKQDGQ